MSTSPHQRRAFRGDARFFVGIALVAVSVGGVWTLLSSADGTRPALQATRTIVPGESISADDVAVVDVDLGTLADDYLQPHELVEGAVADRTVEAGELLPAGVITTSDDRRSTTVVVESSTGLPKSIGPGSVVEVWQAPVLDDGRRHDSPRLLVGDVVVRSVIVPEGVLAEESAEVELVIERSDVADVLAAITGGSSLSVVPVGADR